MSGAIAFDLESVPSSLTGQLTARLIDLEHFLVPVPEGQSSAPSEDAETERLFG